MSQIEQARAHTIQGLSHISNFWGFSKGMGAIFGALYLSQTPLSLDALVEQINITKGAVSTNIRHLERLGLVHKQVVIGERKDFYTAETDFWKIARCILREREKSEFDRAIHTVTESLEMIDTAGELSPEEAKLALFYQKRLQTLADFFKSLDKLVAMFLSMDSLVGSTFDMLFGKKE